VRERGGGRERERERDGEVNEGYQGWEGMLSRMKGKKGRNGMEGTVRKEGRKEGRVIKERQGQNGKDKTVKKEGRRATNNILEVHDVFCVAEELLGFGKIEGRRIHDARLAPHPGIVSGHQKSVAGSQ
jgi:hypothetical protein